MCAAVAKSGVLCQLALYAVRLAGAFLLMEVMTHALYFNSIAKHKLWQRFASELKLGAVHVGMTGFWVLMFVWLKVLIALCKSGDRH